MKGMKLNKISHFKGLVICLLAGLVILLPSCGRTAEKYYNYVAIYPTDSMDDIVWKAAHVVPSQRQLEWQKLELTAFVHFGLNTFAEKQWGSGSDNPELFNPTDFDPEQWVSVLKQAGFRSLLLTCKHHDGFCLWPSAYTDYDLTASPWKDGKGDVVKEVSEACRKYGLLFGVYLSPWDMHEQTYGTPEYNDFFVNQLTELLTQYGPIAEVWFDGACGEGPNGKKQEYDFDRWYKLIRELQPQAIISIMGPDVRWVGNERGIARKTEWSVVPNDKLDPAMIAENSQKELIMPPTKVTMDKDLGSREVISKARTLVWYPAETDVSIRPSWFYSSKDDGCTKSAEQLLNIYFTSVGRNSNLLLNVPPDKTGRFGADEVESLLGFAELRKKTFAHDFLKEASSSSLDKSESDWGGIEWTWDKSMDFSIFMVQEDISQGQRVEEFSLEYMGDDGTWIEAASGTTIGYKRLLQFEPVTASRVRLVIKSARHTPIICGTGLF